MMDARRRQGWKIDNNPSILAKLQQSSSEPNITSQQAQQLPSRLYQKCTKQVSHGSDAECKCAKNTKWLTVRLVLSKETAGTKACFSVRKESEMLH
jgi:hypothetical protein